jgi:hypothetical protein
MTFKLIIMILIICMKKFKGHPNNPLASDIGTVAIPNTAENKGIESGNSIQTSFAVKKPIFT